MLHRGPTRNEIHPDSNIASTIAPKQNHLDRGTLHRYRKLYFLYRDSAFQQQLRVTRSFPPPSFCALMTCIMLHNVRTYRLREDIRIQMGFYVTTVMGEFLQNIHFSRLTLQLSRYACITMTWSFAIHLAQRGRFTKYVFSISTFVVW